MEIWKDVKGFEGIYMVSNLGNVKSLDRIIANFGIHKNVYKKGNRLKTSNALGYRVVKLSKNGIGNAIKVHRLVLDSFLENKENKPFVNHKNGIKHDNRLENLEWCTAKENNQHSYDNGLKKRMYGKYNGASKIVLDLNTGIFYESCKEASIINGFNHSTLKSILNGNSKNTTSLIYA